MRDYLRTHGAVEDPAGYATTVLKDAIGYAGTAVGFIQMVAAMDRDGEIVRDIRGKRTYRIALSQADSTALAAPRLDVPAAAAAAAAAANQAVEIDYDGLARAIVREFFAQAGPPAPAPALTDGQAAAGRLGAEREEYALRLEIARLRLDALLGDRAEERGSLLKRLSLDD
jgi:hypothetical protein